MGGRGAPTTLVQDPLLALQMPDYGSLATSHRPPTNVTRQFHSAFDRRLLSSLRRTDDLLLPLSWVVLGCGDNVTPYAQIVLGGSSYALFLIQVFNLS